MSFGHLPARVILPELHNAENFTPGLVTRAVCQAEAWISPGLATVCQNTTFPAPAPARNDPAHYLLERHFQSEHTKVMRD